MAPDEPADVAAVKQVLSYFVLHPLAADDLEGIARWRLLEEMIISRIDETNRALAWLVAQGFLHVHTNGPGPIFSLNPDNLDDAQAFLADQDAGADAGPKGRD